MPKTFTQRYDEALATERQRPGKSDDRYFEKYQYGIGSSKQHKEAMDYIYNRVEDSDEPGVHLAFEETQSIMLDIEDEEVRCQKCKRGIEVYYEAVFVVGIYVNDEKKGQEFWCKQCAVKGMKWSNKHPLLKGDF